MGDLLSLISSVDGRGMRHFDILINGCWQCVGSGAAFAVTNPATGEVIGQVPDCDRRDVELAVQAARDGADLERYRPLERLEIMERARHILLEHREEMATIITGESGKPLSVSQGEVTATAERLHLTMEETRVLYGEYLPGEWVGDTVNKFALVFRKPLGVVAAISPFNYPLFIAAAKIIPAILAGNRVIAKPASETPLSLIALVKILELAGMPPGTINIVTGRGATIGDAIVGHPDIDAVSFTGSTGVGERIAKLAGIKKLHLELGGKAAAIVLADAKLEATAKQLCRGAFRNSGQRCDAVSRVLAYRRIKDELVERVLAETAAYRTGDPRDPKTALGTVINRKAVERIDALVKDAVDKGARLLAGGRADGLFYEATVLDGVTTDMRIAWEEIFGPVLPIMTVAGADEAVRLSNRSEYGLDSCIFTADITLALKIAKDLQDGSVTINAAPAHGVGHFPFGGNKKSGLGREGIRYSLDELTRLHTVILNTE